MRQILICLRLTAWAPTRKALRSSNRKTSKPSSRLTNSWVPFKVISGVKELDTGLAMPVHWDHAADEKRATEHALQVARCTKIINAGDPKEMKFVINIKQMAKFVVGLDEKLAPEDVE